MIKSIFILVFLTISSFFIIQSNSTNHENLRTFLGKEVNELLEDPNYSNYEDIGFITPAVTQLAGIYIFYPNNIRIDVYINELEYTELTRVDRKWDMENINREKISRIEVFENDKYVFDTAR